MRRVWIAVLLASGCAAAEPSAPRVGKPAHVARTLVPEPVVLGVRPGPAGAHRIAVSRIDQPVLEQPTSLAAPADVTCSVEGSGSPFPTGCGGGQRSLMVNRARHGHGAVARFQPKDVDVTWGFLSGSSTKAWIQVRDRGLLLTGYADLASERFRLNEDVNALPKHVWFQAGAPVLVRGGTGKGVTVRVDGDIAGVSQLSAKVDCGVLAYTPPPPAPRALPQPRSPRPTLVPRGASLSLRTAPGVPAFAVLRDDDRLSLTLEVVEARPHWTQVRFDTTHAHFEAWVESSQLSGEHFGVGRAGSCGSSRTAHHRPGTVHDVLESVPVFVGAAPDAKDRSGVFIGRGARVSVNSRKDGFATIRVQDSQIQPPEGQEFWVAEDVLGPSRGPSRPSSTSATR